MNRVFLQSIAGILTALVITGGALFPLSVRALSVPFRPPDAPHAVTPDAVAQPPPLPPPLIVPKSVEKIKELKREEEEAREAAERARGNPANSCSVKALEEFGLEFVGNAIQKGFQKGVKALGKLVEKAPSPFSLIGKGLGSLGGEELVNDPGGRLHLKGLRVKDCLKALKEQGVKIVYNDFKKRLLDSMVDDTLQWIKNGFKDGPGFYQDFGGALKNAANAAVGDIAQDIGLAEFCSPIQRQFAAQFTAPFFQYAPPFSQQISCTLTDIVGNVKDFGDDFTKGGWKGYLELAKPQNNRFGQTLLVLDELNRRTAEKEREQELELLAYQGLKPTKECVEWKLINRRTGRVTGSVFSESEKTRYDPLVYDTTECAKEEVTTPGSLVKSYFDAAVNAEYRYVTDADDLTPYLSAIIDTSLRRLVDAGVEGLAGLRASRSSRGEKPKTYSEQADEIAKSPDLTDEEKVEQLASLQGLAESGRNVSLAENQNTQLLESNKKMVRELEAFLPSVLLLITQTEEVQTHTLVLMRGADQGNQGEVAIFQKYGFGPLETQGLLSCQKNLPVQNNVGAGASCDVTRRTADSVKALGVSGEIFQMDRDMIQAFGKDVKEIDGELNKKDISENDLIGLGSHLSSMMADARKVERRHKEFSGILGSQPGGGKTTAQTTADDLRACLKHPNPPYICTPLP